MPNNSKATLLFLGTGGSMGIPVIGCGCQVCTSQSPYNSRLRPSALITIEGVNILIDAGPDFRTQALRYGINHLEGVIFTHAHHDHTAGIDDLRVFNMWTKRPLPCLTSKETANDLQERYGYIFSKTKSKTQLVSNLELDILYHERGSISFLGQQFSYFTFEQAGMPVTGFRFGNLAFVSDIREYPESIFEDLAGVDKLVLSALRHQASPMHFSIAEAVAFSQKAGAKQTWLTHIAHEVDHDIANQDLPLNVFLAYDGLTLDFHL